MGRRESASAQPELGGGSSSGSPPSPRCGRPHQHQTKKEGAVFISVVFLLLTAVAFVYSLDAGSNSDSSRWAEESWIESSCLVMAAGIAYRGDCKLGVSLTMTQYKDFAECMGESGRDYKAAHEDWLQTVPGRCGTKADNMFNDGVEFVLAEEKRRLGEITVGRRLNLPFNREHRWQCTNGFLPWAEVMVTNGTEQRSWGPVCAYKYGSPAASATGDWNAARSTANRLRSGILPNETVKCWALEADDCVVALDEADALRDKRHNQLIVVKILGCICLGVAVLMGVIAFVWHLMDHGFLGIVPPGGYERSVPLHEPGEEGVACFPEASPLSERVKRLVGVAAQRFTDNTPAGSGGSTLRLSRGGSRRTVEIGGNAVPRNFAADFIANPLGTRSGAPTQATSVGI